VNPDSAVQNSQNRVGPFQNFQPYLYWSKSPAVDAKQGFVTFSFSTGFQGAQCPCETIFTCCRRSKASCKARLRRSRQPLAGQSRRNEPYTTRRQVTWLADANLAARQTFGIAEINRGRFDGSRTAVRWVNALNQPMAGHGYLGRRTGICPRPGRLTPPAA